ncbi:hypothetical protein [Arthrobacter sp. E3]|uniref:hypothetical protein n=1 Tax=Arthrobacter sp. E3 TaxID=517402 RepID=UPI001A947A60|nr:hypothetical protein [Arthrobacter sp. E3]
MLGRSSGASTPLLHALTNDFNVVTVERHWPEGKVVDTAPVWLECALIRDDAEPTVHAPPSLTVAGLGADGGSGESAQWDASSMQYVRMTR